MSSSVLAIVFDQRVLTKIKDLLVQTIPSLVEKDRNAQCERCGDG